MQSKEIQSNTQQSKAKQKSKQWHKFKAMQTNANQRKASKAMQSKGQRKAKQSKERKAKQSKVIQRNTNFELGSHLDNFGNWSNMLKTDRRRPLRIELFRSVSKTVASVASKRWQPIWSPLACDTCSCFGN